MHGAELIAKPYRCFFPLGWAVGLLVFLLWVFFAFTQKGVNPILLHQQGAASLLVGSFAIGFLLTALPRFTAAPHATGVDIVLLLALSIAETVALFAGFADVAHWGAAVKFAYLLYFALRCMAQGQINLPNRSWIIFGIMSGAVGNFLCTTHMAPLGTTLASRGLLTGLFVGVGSRMVPMLSGILTAPLKVNRIFDPLHRILALMFFIGLFIEADNLRLASALQAVVLALEIIYLWRLFRLPNRGSRAISLWIAGWLMLLAPTATCLYPAWRNDFLHVSFIGVFLMGTVALASHVIVMHEQRRQELLVSFWPLAVICGLILSAALTRATAKIANYWHHLGYAAVSLVIALLLWGYFFLLRRR